MNLEEEAFRATELLKGKTIKEILRNREGEVFIKFTDGTRFFINKKADGLDLSITNGPKTQEIE